MNIIGFQIDMNMIRFQSPHEYDGLLRLQHKYDGLSSQHEYDAFSSQ